ncbi:MAG: hypothetical protein C5B49_02485 [Bdellovibrio sp.]|nr:MAG: hypothetical protein C5B49_02485 [Bdellovibrio sp.]
MGTTLYAGQMIAMGSFALTMQADGDLVLLDTNGNEIWGTDQDQGNDVPGFSGPTSALSCGSCYAAFQSDGNLVLYNPSFLNSGSNHAYWASNSARFSGVQFYFLSQSPFISIYNSDSTAALWSGLGPYIPPGTIINAGQSVLFPRGLKITMQTDGDLVVSNSTGNLWATSDNPTGDSLGFSGPTSGLSCNSCYASFQADGNLVLYNPFFTGNSNKAYWSSRTAQNPQSLFLISPLAPVLSIRSNSGTILFTSN